MLTGSVHNKRIAWIDVIKYICIMFVMLSHLESRTEFLRVFYFPFVLTGFLFASGYVYRNIDRFSAFFVKKIKGLFVPWLFFSVFVVVTAHILTFKEHRSLLEELKWNFLQIRGFGDEMWFVAALFVAFIPFYFIIRKYEAAKKAHRKNATVMLLMVGIAMLIIHELYVGFMNPNLLPWGTVSLPWHIDYIFYADFWMILGYLFRNNFEPVYEEKVTTPIGIAGILVYLLLCYVPFLLKTEIQIEILKSLLGVFCLIFVSKRIKPNKYVLYIGGNTIICFALHGKLLSLMQAFLSRLLGNMYSGILQNTFASSILAVVLTIAISLILIVPIYVINRWFPFLIGRKYQKRKSATAG